MTPAVDPGVFVHDFQAFECTNCGRCCKPWRVSIDPHQFQEIERSQAYQARTRVGYLPLENSGDGLARLGERDGACVFLDEKSMCSLHAELGGLGKPLGCQLYPYQIMETPDGTYAHLSFGCPPVVAGLDRDVETNRRELSASLAFRQSLARQTSGETAPFVVQLSEQQTIGWSSYQHLESKILAAYSSADPLVSIMRMVLSICRASSHGAGSEATPDWPGLALQREEVDFPGELWVKYLGLLVGSLENLQDRPMRDAFIKAVQDGLRVSSQRFGMELPPLGLTLSRQSWMLQTYDRYFRNAVLGKSLLKTTILARLMATGSAIALAEYFAEAFRQSRGKDLIDLDDLTDAFEIVEVQIATHTRITEPFFIDLERLFLKISEMPVVEVSA